MIPDKVKKMLDSNEIEMVQLGANLLHLYAPKEDWPKILEVFSFDGDTDLYIRKWEWSIEGDVISIYRFPYHQGTLTHVLTHGLTTTNITITQLPGFGTSTTGTFDTSRIWKDGQSRTSVTS